MALLQDGADIGTTYLAVASPTHDKMTILGDLLPAGDGTKARLEAAIRDLVGPNRPMHIVEVKVVARVVKMDEIAPPVKDDAH